MHSSKDFIKCSSPPIISPYIGGQWSVWWTISIKSQKKIGKHFPNAAYSVMKILCFRVKNMAWNQQDIVLLDMKKHPTCTHIVLLYNTAFYTILPLCKLHVYV